MITDYQQCYYEERLLPKVMHQWCDEWLSDNETGLSLTGDATAYDSVKMISV
jgi:hypothetical protein